MKQHRTALKARKTKSATGGVTVRVDPPELSDREIEEGDDPGAPIPVDQPMDDLSSLPGEGFVRVSRVLDNGELGFLRKVPRETLADDLGFIGRTWGGGNYYLEVFDQDRRWVRKFKQSFDAGEYGSPKGAMAQTRSDSPDVDPSLDLSNFPPPMQPVARFVEREPGDDIPRQGRRGVLDVIAESQERAAAQAAESRKEMMTMFTEMLKVVQAKPVAAPYQDVLATAQQIAANARPAPAVENPMMPIVTDLVAKVADRLLDRLDNVGAPEGSVLERIAMKAFESFTPVLARVVANSVPKPPARPVGVVAAPKAGPSLTHTPAPAVETPPAEVPPVVPAAPEQSSDQGVSGAAQVEVAAGDNGGIRLIDRIKAHPMYAISAPTLLEMARVGTDPVTAAETIDSLVPDAYYSYLDDIIKRPDMVDYLATFEAEVAQYGEWFKTLAVELKKLGEEEIEPAPEKEGAVVP